MPSSTLALCCLSCCEVKLTNETPHPGHLCFDLFQVSSHLNIMDRSLPSPWSLTVIVPLQPINLQRWDVCEKRDLGQRSASPVLCPPRARWHLKVSQAVKSALWVSLYFPPPHFTPLLNSCCHPMTPPLSLFLLPNEPTPFLPLHPQAPGAGHPSSSSSISAEIPLLFWRQEILVEGKQEGKPEHTLGNGSQSQIPTVRIGEAQCEQRHYRSLITAFWGIFHVFFF